MIKLLKCEFMKTRRRYIFLTAFAITAIGLVWALYGDYNGKNGQFLLENGWMMFLYQLPLTNSIIFPLMSMVVASRLADVEHKAIALKQLFTIEKKGKLFDAKLIYGLGMVMVSVLINWSVIVIFGKIIGFGGALPLNLYLKFLLFTAVPTIAIYMIQHSLSLIFKNQAAAFFSGIIGTFAGLFSMFLPQFPALRRCLPWGYYGALQFVGLFGWAKETRYDNAYFEIMQIDWLSFAMLLAATVVFYFIGRTIFCKREV